MAGSDEQQSALSLFSSGDRALELLAALVGTMFFVLFDFASVVAGFAAAFAGALTMGLVRQLRRGLLGQEPEGVDRP